MNTQPTIQLPGQWSTIAPTVDWMYYFIFWVSVVFFVGIVGAMLYFVVKYRRRPGVKAEPTGHNTVLEVTWTVLPVFLLAVMFHKGFQGFINLRVAPVDDMQIRVHAKKWLWEFEYPNGARSLRELTIPVNKPVRVILSSDDVIHSFFVPAFRVKQDAVPGFYQSLWFQATQTGDVDLFCAEYCGTGHSSMLGTIHIIPQERYATFLESLDNPRPGQTVADWGREIFHNAACVTCHGEHGEGGQGPRLAGLLGRTETFSDGASLTADENYIRESILNPQAKIVRGYQPIMPTFRGTLSDRKIEAVITFIRSLH